MGEWLLLNLFTSTLSSICFILIGLLNKFLHDVPSLQIIFISSSICCLLNSWLILNENVFIGISAPERKYLTLKCASKFLSTWFFSESLKLITLSESITLKESLMLIMTIFSSILYKRSLPSVMSQAILFITLLGSTCIANPFSFFEPKRFKGLLFSLLSGISEFITIFLAPKLILLPVSVISLWEFIFSAILSFVWIRYSRINLISFPNPIVLSLLSLSSLPYYIISKYNLPCIDDISIFSIEIIISLIIQRTFLNEPLNYTTYLGAALIMLSFNILIGLRILRTFFYLTRKWMDKMIEMITFF